MYTYYNPQKVIIGLNSFNNIGEIVCDYGSRALVLLYNFFKNDDTYKILDNSFRKKNIEYITYSTFDSEPTPKMCADATQLAREFKANVIVAVGGGSVIDTAKVVSALAVNGGEVKQYLEGVGDGSKIINQPLPLIAVPTTAGTGAEATKNAVISCDKLKYKKSFRDERLFAKVVVIDPLRHITTPKNITAFSGMDAITQLVESYTTKKANPFTDALALKGMSLACSLERAYDDLSNLGARQDMAIAAYMSGVCLANSGLGAAHGVAASLGVHFKIPHGEACAMLLPKVMMLNYSACKQRYTELSGSYFNNSSATAEMLIDKIISMNKKFDINSTLKQFNLTDGDIKIVATDSFGSSMSGNPIDLSNNDIQRLICDMHRQ